MAKETVQSLILAKLQSVETKIDTVAMDYGQRITKAEGEVINIVAMVEGLVKSQKELTDKMTEILKSDSKTEGSINTFKWLAGLGPVIVSIIVTLYFLQTGSLIDKRIPESESVKTLKIEINGLDTRIQTLERLVTSN